MRIAALFVAYSAIFTFDSASVLADEGVQTVASDHTLSEITVSARKRDENLEKVPASVTVVTSADLQVTYTGSLAALTDSAPNVVFHTVGEFGHSSSLNIRGVGGGGANLDTDPAVAIYVDGQYQTVNSTNLERELGRYRFHRGAARSAGHPVWS